MSFETGPECRTPRTCRAGQSCEEVARVMHATLQGTMGSWTALACGFSPEKREDDIATPQAVELASDPPTNYGELSARLGGYAPGVVAPTHRCNVCGALWRFWPYRDTGHTASWSLRSTVAGPCCDNIWKGDQIEPLTLGHMSACLRHGRPVVAWLVREIGTEHPLLSFEASAVAASITQASWAADGFESEIVELFEW